MRYSDWYVDSTSWLSRLCFSPFSRQDGLGASLGLLRAAPGLRSRCSSTPTVGGLSFTLAAVLVLCVYASCCSRVLERSGVACPAVTDRGSPIVSRCLLRRIVEHKRRFPSQPKPKQQPGLARVVCPTKGRCPVGPVVRSCQPPVRSQALACLVRIPPRASHPPKTEVAPASSNDSHLRNFQPALTLC